MSYTPNPTWVDGVNDVDAASLNHIEAGVKDASDRLDTIGTNGSFDSVLRTELLGGANRTTRVSAKVRVTTTFTLSQNVDTWAQTNWSKIKDTDNAFHTGSSTANDYWYWTCPLARRYDVFLHVQSQAGAADTILVAEVSLNSAAANASIARGVMEVAANTELTADARAISYPLNVGDKLYWGMWCKGSNLSIGTAFGNTDTVLTIRDAGPQ